MVACRPLRHHELLFGEDKPPTAEALGPLVRECAAVEDSLQCFLEFFYSPRGVADRYGPGGLLCEVEPNTCSVSNTSANGEFFFSSGLRVHPSMRKNVSTTSVA